MTKSEAVGKLIAWAESQVGYKAGANQDNKYARKIDSIDGWMNTLKNFHDWCTLFVCAGFDECFDYPTAREMLRQPTSSLGAGCKYAARYYKQDNALFDLPQKGDQIFFGAEGDDHTGIVVDVRQGKVYTIEGNAGDYPGEVARRTYDLSDKWIYAFGRPDWSLVADAPSLAPADYHADPDRIWDYLSGWLGNDFGAAGLMGNLEAESGLISAIVQYGSGWSSEDYTEAVDDGTYKDFSEDGNGYGLAQWTYHTRKEKLLRHARSMDASIGNLDAQLDYLSIEIEAEYPSVFSILKKATSVAQASDAVLLWYERPADQSVENLERRRARGQIFYNKYHGEEPKPTPTPGGYCEVKARILGIGDEGNDVKTLQGALMAHGYDLEYCGGADGIFGEGTEYAVRAYQKEHSLVVDGEVGPATWGALLEE